MSDRAAPHFAISVLGEVPLSEELYESIDEFEFEDHASKPDKLRFTVHDPSGGFWDNPAFRKGQIIAFWWGLPGRTAPSRTAVVKCVKGGYFAPSVEADAVSVLMGTQGRTRVFENITVSELATRIAEEYGFGPEDRHIQITTERRATISQAGATDAGLLRRLADAEGFDFRVDASGLHFRERDLKQSPLRTFDFLAGDIIGPPVIENDITGLPARVLVRGRDPKTKKVIEASVDNSSDEARPGLAPVIELVDLENRTTRVHGAVPIGLGDLSKALTGVRDIAATGARGTFPFLWSAPEARVATEEIVTAKTPTPEGVKREAKQRFRDGVLAAVRMTITVHGDPLLQAKTVVEVVGLGKRLSGRYWVQRAVHSIRRGGGYQTTLELLSDGHGGHSTTGDSRLDLGFSGRAGSGAAAGADDLSRALLDLMAVARRVSETRSSPALIQIATEAEAEHGRIVQRAFPRVREAARTLITAGKSLDEPELVTAAQRVLALAKGGGGQETPSGAQLGTAEKAQEDILEALETLDLETRDTAVRFVPRDKKPRPGEA